MKEMKPLIRYGKRIPLLPSVQIRRELRMFCAQEDIRERCAEAEGMPIDSSWEQICERRTLLAVEI
ncbi:MAG TPA: hypothetical protein VHD95_10080 [Rhizomicrobium sp.]|nr:hypothetical protein [Rhizomicrobium sp.]